MGQHQLLLLCIRYPALCRVLLLMYWMCALPALVLIPVLTVVVSFKYKA